MTETTPSSKTRPPKQSRTGLKANGTRKAASKSNRSRAREFALQALYQHIVGRNDAAPSIPSHATWQAFTRPTQRTTTLCCMAASTPLMIWTP